MRYYFECNMGCGIREFPSGTKLTTVKNNILAEVGTANNPKNIRKATQADIDWVVAMGGWME